MSRAIYLKDSNKEMLQQMQTAGFNVVKCGMCGEVKLIKISAEDLTCEWCGFESDQSDFPDLVTVEELREVNV